MNIIYAYTPQGGFLCADLKSRVTSYSYPGSGNAREAKTRPIEVAEAALSRVMDEITECLIPPSTQERIDLANWGWLDSLDIHTSSAIPEEVLKHAWLAA